MDQKDIPRHDSSALKTKTDARQGETSGRMRWVLLWSTLLAIVVMGGGFILTMVYSAHQ